MLSARRQHALTRLAAAGCAGALALGTLAGCETTQDKAAKHQAEAQQILDARAKRQAQKQQDRKKGGKAAKPQNGGKQ